MKRQELCIGNWILVPNSFSGHYQITQIAETVICTTYGWYLFSEVEPIETSEEWLLKFGFKEADIKGDFQLGNYLVRDVNFGTGVNPNFHWAMEFNSEDDWYLIARCPYVHQVQNLILLLTGKVI